MVSTDSAALGSGSEASGTSAGLEKNKHLNIKLPAMLRGKEMANHRYRGTNSSSHQNSIA